MSLYKKWDRERIQFQLSDSKNGIRIRIRMTNGNHQIPTFSLSVVVAAPSLNLYTFLLALSLSHLLGVGGQTVTSYNEFSEKVGREREREKRERERERREN